VVGQSTVDLMINEEKSDEFESIAQAMIASSKKETGPLGCDWQDARTA
jgi:hypothetical protein